jgi:hypothetical protein
MSNGWVTCGREWFAWSWGCWHGGECVQGVLCCGWCRPVHGCERARPVRGSRAWGWILRVRDTCGSWRSIEGTCGASVCVPLGMGIPKQGQGLLAGLDMDSQSMPAEAWGDPCGDHMDGERAGLCR